MKKHLKQTFSLIMSLIMIMSMFTGLEVSSVAEDDILNYLTYEIVDGEVTITDCDTEISGDVVLPDTIEGYPVTIIGEYAFCDCVRITTVTIPEGVTTIGRSAFLLCYQLKQITIPASVTSVSDSAFSDCIELKQIYVSENNEYYSSDENGVLFNKDKTYLLRFPPNNDATQYVIPDSTITVGDRALASNKNLKTITIGAYLKTLQTHALSADNLEKIIVDKNNKYFFSDEYGVLFNKDKTELLIHPPQKKQHKI